MDPRPSTGLTGYVIMMLLLVATIERQGHLPGEALLEDTVI